MKKNIFIIVFIVCFMAVYAWGANTVKITSTTIDISDIDSDWDFSSETEFSEAPFNQGLLINNIQFIGGAASDQCIIYDHPSSGTSAVCFDVTVSDVTDPKLKVMAPVQRYHPKLLYSEGTYSSGARVIILLDAE